MLAFVELIYYICGMGIEKIRKVIYTDEFMDYYWSLDAKLREKYSYIVNIIETQKVVNEKFVKKLVGTPYYEAVCRLVQTSIVRLYSLLTKRVLLSVPVCCL